MDELIKSKENNHYKLMQNKQMIEPHSRPCSAHAYYVGTDKRLVMGHDALHLRHVASFYINYHVDMITHCKTFEKNCGDTDQKS